MIEFTVTIKKTYEGLLFDGVPLSPQMYHATHTVLANDTFHAEELALLKDSNAFKIIDLPPTCSEVTVVKKVDFINAGCRLI